MAGLLSWKRDRSASLFERIQQRTPEGRRSSRHQELLASIKHNLNQVLNTHPGASQSAPELGVIDLNDATASTADFHKAIEKAIRHCIIAYEPRISEVEVCADESDEQDPLTLSFHIAAQVDFDNMDHAIEFNIHLDNQQRYYLS